VTTTSEAATATTTATTGAEGVIGVSSPSPEVRRIEMRRPERLNAMDAEMVGALHEALAEAEGDPRCRVVVLTGAGRGFCAGLDLNGYGDPPNAAVESGPIHRTLGTQRQIAALVQRIRRMPQVVVAQVNGPAAGGGLALVCAADVRIAAEEAIFASSFIRIGVTGAELADRVDRLIVDLLRAPPLSLALTKQGMWMSMEIPSFDVAVEVENRQQVLTSATEDRAEARATYRSGAAPVYHHR
jgi:enoyl-CoA hydratase/carnithine racemase